MNVRTLISLLRRTAADWSAHDAPRMGAALAFYTILSLAPLLLLTVTVVALAFGHDAAQEQILSQAQGMVGKDGAAGIGAVFEHAQKPASSAVASIIGIMTLLFGASGVFGELRSALNKMWDVTPAATTGFIGMLKEKFFSFGMVLTVGFLLLVSLVISAGLAALGKFFGGILPLPEFVLSAINFLISFAAISVLFALIFKYVPETKIPWRSVWLGAIVTAFLFAVGKSLIGIYLGKAAVGSAYGAAGSLIVVLVWVYYSSLLFFFGAEFTHVVATPSPEANGTKSAQ